MGQTHAGALSLSQSGTDRMRKQTCPLRAVIIGYTGALLLIRSEGDAKHFCVVEEVSA